MPCVLRLPLPLCALQLLAATPQQQRQQRHERSALLHESRCSSLQCTSAWCRIQWLAPKTPLPLLLQGG
jgi:hypothetical protein